MRNWSKNSNLVKCIVSFLLFHLSYFYLNYQINYFFHSIQFFVVDSLYFEDAGEWSLS